MAKRRLSPLQQMLKDERSGINTQAATPARPSTPSYMTSASPVRSVVSGGSSSVSKPKPSGPAPSWRPSYFKPTPSLSRTVQLLSQGVIQEENYDMSAHLGQMLESRYDSYRDKLDTRFDVQRDKYEHALKLAEIYAKDKDHEGNVEVPEMPKLPGLGRGMGERGLNKQLEKALQNVSDPDVAENISRYYRYEKERVQSLKNAYREQRKSIRGLRRDFDFSIEEAVARGDVDPDELIKPEPKQPKSAVGPKAAGVIPLGNGVVRNSSAHRDEQEKDDDDDGTFLGIPIPKGPLSGVTNAIEGGLEKIGGEAKDPLFWTLDKLSRPIYGVMEATKQAYTQDEDRGQNFWDVAGASISGANIANSADEFMDHPGEFIGEVAKGFGRGFSGRDKTTFRDVVSLNAERDNVKDMRDSTTYQTWIGLTGDLVYDPLNAVGVGLVKKPIDALKVAGEVNDLRKTSEEIARVASSSQHAVSPMNATRGLTDPDYVYHLLTGGVKRKPHNMVERRANIHEVSQNVDFIMHALKTAEINMDTRKLASIEDLGAALTARREALVTDFGDEVLSDSLRSSMETSVQAGTATADDMEELVQLLDNLESDEIADLLTPANERDKFLNNTAEREFNTGTINAEAEGFAEDSDFVRTQVDNLDQWSGQHKGVPQAGAKIRNIKGEGSDVHSLQGEEVMGDINASANRRARNVGIAGHVDEGSREAKSGKRKATQRPWEVASKDPKNAERIAEILSEAGPDFKASLPSRLREDPRLADFDWDRARRASWAMHGKTAAGRKRRELITTLTNDIKSKRSAVSTNRAKGNDSFADKLEGELKALMARRDSIVRRRDRHQSAIIIRLAKAHIAEQAGAKTYRNPEAATALSDELAEIDRLLAAYGKDDLGNVVDAAPTPRGPAVGRDAADTDEISFLDRPEPTTPKVSGKPEKAPVEAKGGQGAAPDLSHLAGPDAAAKGKDSIAPSGERVNSKRYAENSDIYEMNDVGLRQRRAQVEADLKSLEGVDPNGKASSLMDAPPEYVKDGKLDTEALGKALTFDSATHSFKIKDGQPPSPWLTKYVRVLQAEYEHTFDRLRNGKDAKALNKTPTGERGKEWWRSKNAITAKASKAAHAEAIKNTEKAFEAQHLYETIYSESLDLMLPKRNPEQAVVQHVKAKQEAERIALQAEKKVANLQGAKAEVARIDAELGALRQQHTAERIAVQKSVQEARLAQKAMHDRLREEALFRAASIALAPKAAEISIKVLGNDLVLPGSGAMLEKGRILNGLPIIKGSRQFFADAFKSPASSLTPEGQLLRARAVAHTPNIIEHHINKLRQTLGNIREPDRRRVFVDMVQHGYAPKPGVDPHFDAIKEAFDDLIPFFRNEVPVGDGPLTKADINRYLPPGFSVNENAKISSMQDLVKAVRANKANSKYDVKMYRDPYRMSWVLRVAVEQAQARRALEYQIGKAFGVKRGAVINDAGKVVKSSVTEANRGYYETVEKFHELGWETVPSLGNKHYFPKELVPEVHKLLDMMEPDNVHKFGEMVDKSTRLWKTMTTIYNPGYWTRNGIGETMSSWLAGVHDPRAYTRAADIIKYARKDGQEVEDLAKHLPGVSVKSDSVKGNKVMYKRHDGDVTAERLWADYNNTGLKTGFVNTEFSSNFSKVGTALRDTGGVKALGKGHDQLRGAGEWYEDYFRMAHFADAIRRSPKKYEEAVRDAAAEVRKYHFDYTDFTKFEKMAMLRAFPFYKWTRKAAPLMMTMLFTKPGKMMAYPKVMNAISTQDIARDDNGFAPNYEGIVPGWMQDMWAYKIAEGNDEDETYFNMSTPQMDALKSTVNPGSTAAALFNPIFSKPLEMVGLPPAKLFKEFDTTDNSDMNLPLENWGDRGNAIARVFPQGNMLQKVLADGATDWQDTASFGSGLGFYKNDDGTRSGERINDKETDEPFLRKLFKGIGL